MAHISCNWFRGEEISNKVVPGLGTVISILIAFGGLAFNIGNIAGAGLGLNAIFGLDVKWAQLLLQSLQY